MKKGGVSCWLTGIRPSEALMVSKEKLRFENEEKEIYLGFNAIFSCKSQKRLLIFL